MAAYLHSVESERPANRVLSVSAPAMVAAPLALLSAMVVHPAHAADGGSWLAAAEASPARFYAAHLLILVAVALFVPDREASLWALGRLVVSPWHRQRHAAPIRAKRQVSEASSQVSAERLAPRGRRL